MKRVIITEELEQNILGKILSESFSPKIEVVKMIKDYLDKNFIKQKIDDIGENGDPIVSNIFLELSQVEKKPIKTHTPHDLLLKLDDKYHWVMSNDNDRILFLKQLINDWNDDKINGNGLLSKNIIGESIDMNSIMDEECLTVSEEVFKKLDLQNILVQNGHNILHFKLEYTDGKIKHYIWNGSSYVPYNKKNSDPKLNFFSPKSKNNKTFNGNLKIITENHKSTILIRLKESVPHRELTPSEIPINTAECYKLFKYDPNKPGLLFPLYVNTSVGGEGLKVGVWYKSGVGELWGKLDYVPNPNDEILHGITLEELVELYNVSNEKTRNDIYEDLKNNYIIKLDQVNSSLGPLSYRPGWHGSSLPMADHIGPTKKVIDVYKEEIKQLGPNIPKVNKDDLVHFKKIPAAWYEFMINEKKGTISCGGLTFKLGNLPKKVDNNKILIFNYSIINDIKDKKDVKICGVSIFNFISKFYKIDNKENIKEYNYKFVNYNELYKIFKTNEILFSLNENLSKTISKFVLSSKNITKNGEKKSIENYCVWNGNEYTDSVRYRDNNQFFAKCLVGSDKHVLVQATANSKGKSNIKKCITDVEELDGGYYMYKTNSNANDDETWIIADSIKIVKVLTDEEKDDIINQNYKPNNEYMIYNAPNYNGGIKNKDVIDSMKFPEVQPEE